MINGFVKKENGKVSLAVPKLEFEDIIPTQVKRNNHSSGKIHVNWRYIDRNVLVLVLPKND